MRIFSFILVIIGAILILIGLIIDLLGIMSYTPWLQFANSIILLALAASLLKLTKKE